MYTIVIRNRLDRIKLTQEVASQRDIQRLLGCSRATSYRILSRYAVARVVDHGRKKPYRVMKLTTLIDVSMFYRRKPAGNQRFKDPEFQRELARRPRHKKV